MHFSGEIEFGVTNQSYFTFNHVLGNFSLIVYQFQAITAFSVVIDRLGEFNDIFDQSNSLLIEDSKPKIVFLKFDQFYGIALECNGADTFEVCPKLLEIEHLTLQTPQYTMTLIEDFSLVVTKGDHLLIMGPSGSGKMSLLRAIAGICCSGKGIIRFHIKQSNKGSDRSILQGAINNDGPVNGTNYRTKDKEHQLIDGTEGSSEAIFFVPPMPYMVLGTLRQQLLYPTWIEDLIAVSESYSLPFSLKSSRLSNTRCELKTMPNEDELVGVLKVVCLDHLITRCNDLGSNVDWSCLLSLGEQQRLAFAPLLLAQPELALLDESTSALAEANEVRLYK